MPSRSQYALSGMRTGTETCPYNPYQFTISHWYAKPKFILLQTKNIIPHKDDG